MVRSRIPTTDEIAPYINANAPFGPVASEQIGNEELSEYLFDRENRAYSVLMQRDPAFVIGRRGAGKTAFLHALTTGTPTLDVTVNTSTAVAEIEDLLRGLTDLNVTLFTEHVADLWNAALWHAVFVTIINQPPDRLERDDRFEAIRIYLTDLSNDAAGSIDGDAGIGLFCYHFHCQVDERRMLARHPQLFTVDRVTLAVVIDAARGLLADAGLSPVLLMDSIEDFQDVLDYHTRTIEGLFMQIGRSGQPDSTYRIRFSFPAELWHVLRMMSRNPLKDFGQRIVLQWSAREIVKIAATRYLLYLHHRQPAFLRAHPEIAAVDTENDRDSLQLLRTVLPPTVTGELGIEEETIAYILRHTQLLPRHLLRLLNSVWIRNTDTGDDVTVAGSAVVQGIRDIEEQIVTEICKAYELIHPFADEACRAVIKNLPRRFTDSELHRAFNRAGKGALKRAQRRLDDRLAAQHLSRLGTVETAGVDMDYFEFKAMLVEVGCIGRQIAQTERYDVAEFAYALPHRLTIGDDDMICVHPLFSGVYQSMGDPGADQRLIYPYGSDPTLDHRSS